jgi:DNA-3-methyladenine glycosylase II
MKPTTTFTYIPKGTFDLLHQNQFFNGWPALKNDPTTIVMAFPVEGWEESAAVTLHQQPDGSLLGKIYGAKQHAEKAKAQALAAMSLDIDGGEWPAIGKKDRVMEELQKRYSFLRPTLFHSPYEASAAFLIGHRITVKQARVIRQNIAEQYGEKIGVEGQTFHAFPLPQKLLKIKSYQSLSKIKIERLHAAADSALGAFLDRDYLRALPEDRAFRELEALPGIGSFFSQGILYRGAGIPDAITHDDLTYYAIQTAYKIPRPISRSTVLSIAARWRPYRMWAVVLLHVWLRSLGKLPKRSFSRTKRDP